jgi:hypothetical protein
MADTEHCVSFSYFFVWGSEEVNNKYTVELGYNVMKGCEYFVSL